MPPSIPIVLLPYGAFALLAVVGLVPLAMELISPSRTMAEHRRRLRAQGPLGAATAAALGRGLEDAKPLRAWALANAAIWLGLAATGATLAFGQTGTRLASLGPLVVVFGGYWLVAGAIILLGRALARRAGPLPPPEAGPAGVVAPIAASGARTGDVGAGRVPEAGEGAPSSAWRRVRGWLWLAAAYLFVSLVDVWGYDFPPLAALAAFTQARRGPLLGVAVALAAVGFVGFMGATLALVLETGGPIRRRGIPTYGRRRGEPRLGRVPIGRVGRPALGAEGGEAWTVSEMKEAWRTGAWRRDPHWRRRYLVTASALVMSLGVLAIPFVLGPPGAQVVTGGALVYLLARVVQAAGRA